jgi:drug/metabolite transporter (DMT)-like permease
MAWAAITYLVLIPGLFCFGTWYRLVEKVPLSLMVITLLLQPPLSALLGWRVLGESLTAEIGVGAALILAALAIGASERPKAVAEEVEPERELAAATA